MLADRWLTVGWPLGSGRWRSTRWLSSSTLASSMTRSPSLSRSPSLPHSLTHPLTHSLLPPVSCSGSGSLLSLLFGLHLALCSPSVLFASGLVVLVLGSAATVAVQLSSHPLPLVPFPD
eukprot:3707514-Rhodomonas_salina.2